MPHSGDNRTTSIRLAAGAIALAICLVAIQIPVAIGATSVDAVEGSAYGAYASVDLGLFNGTLGAVPSVALPADGGEASKSLATAGLTVGLTEIVDLGVLEVSSAASGVGGSEGNVQSVAVVDGTDILGGIIHADEVTASCSADSSGAVGDVTLIGASGAGVGALQVSPAPNTGVSIPGIGTLTLNQQITASDGTLTVTGLSLSLLPVLGTGTVNIARVVCGVETSATTTPTTVSPSPSTTESPSPTQPGPTTTTSPGESTTTSSPGPTTSTAPGAPTTTDPGASTTTSPPDESTTTASVDSTGVNASALEGSGSKDDVSGANESVGDQPDGSEEPSVNSRHDSTVAGLTIQGSGGPPESGQAAAVSSDVTSDPNQAARPWPTIVDLAILGALIGAAGMLAERRRLDLRKLIGKGIRGYRWP
jgi:hypothetical protein